MVLVPVSVQKVMGRGSKGPHLVISQLDTGDHDNPPIPRVPIIIYRTPNVNSHDQPNRSSRHVSIIADDSDSLQMRPHSEAEHSPSESLAILNLTCGGL